tara:strand:- start:55 stop:204 length:150 start_codon:yes stop_codon:yes gene_type:complete
MILYPEEHLDYMYDEYRKMHIRNNVPFLKREDFRVIFEKILESSTIEYV